MAGTHNAAVCRQQCDFLDIVARFQSSLAEASGNADALSRTCSLATECLGHQVETDAAKDWMADVGEKVKKKVEQEKGKLQEEATAKAKQTLETSLARCKNISGGIPGGSWRAGLPEKLPFEKVLAKGKTNLLSNKANQTELKQSLHQLTQDRTVRASIDVLEGSFERDENATRVRRPALFLAKKGGKRN